MRLKFLSSLSLSAAIISSVSPAALHAQNPPPDPSRPLREYRDFAMNHDGNTERGRALFNNQQRTGCALCHSVDGSASRAGPDLLTIGDSYPRRELIRSVLEPSSVIAVGYGTTIVQTKSDETFTGIIKQATADAIDLMGADGKLAHIPIANILVQRGSNLSLMQEGLQDGMSREEFTDLIEYLVSLKEPQSTLANNRGMPSNIPELARPIGVRPFFSEDLRFPHSFVQKPGDVRSGLVWFGQLPGSSNVFIAVHQTGKIWRLQKSETNVTKTLFADIASDIFNERGPNGLLGLAFHPRFRDTRK